MRIQFQVSGLGFLVYRFRFRLCKENRTSSWRFLKSGEKDEGIGLLFLGISGSAAAEGELRREGESGAPASRVWVQISGFWIYRAALTISLTRGPFPVFLVLLIIVN